MDGPKVIEVTIQNIAVGAVWARGCTVGPSPEGLVQMISRACSEAAARQNDPQSAKIRAMVRSMLRFGHYKPTGRGKPASEYLEGRALAGEFPLINVLADSANLASLEGLLPISIIDIRRAKTDHFCVRRGRQGESYIFNHSGQSIDLCDLLLLSAMPEDRPIASPVKDCHETKTDLQTSEALAVVYGPLELRSNVARTSERLAELLHNFAGAQVEVELLEKA